MVRNGCGHPGHKMNGLINGWTELIFHELLFLRITLTILEGCGQKWACDSKFNEWMNLVGYLYANTYLRKVKFTLIVIGWAWSNIGVSF